MTSQLIPLFISSFVISFLATPVVMYASKKLRLIDDPHRGHPGIIHKTPIPRAGGVAMYIAFFLVSLIGLPHSPILIALLIGSGIVVIAGVLDDKYDLSPYVRLFIIWPLAAFVAIAAGLTFYMTNPFGEGMWYLDQLQLNLPALFGQFVLLLPAHLVIVLWIVWVINMVKLSKGASQLPGMAFFAFCTIAAVSLKYASGNPGQFETAALAVIMAGSVLAFVPFNFPPERMLPGDSAAAFIGYTLGVLSMLSGGKLAAAIIVLGIPATDMLATITVRLLQKKNPLATPGQDHLYHKLMALGLDKRIVILSYWIVTAFLGIIAIGLDSGRQKLFVFATVVVGTLGLFVWTHHLLKKRLPK